MTDVFKELSHFSWRGQKYPLTARSASFQQEDVRHRFQFKDGEWIEATGTKNWTFSYTIPFREDIATGPYRNLFTRSFAAFVRDCRNRAIGELFDPVLGRFNARCVSFSDSSDVNKRDGDDVQVEFIHTPDFDDVESTESISNTGGVYNVQGLTSDAEQLDQEVTKVNWEQEEPPQPLVNPISAISGIGRQVEQQGNKYSAALDDTASRAEELDNTIDRLENPQVWPLKRSARRTRDSAILLKERSKDPQRKVVQVVQRYASTISEVAAQLGMTVQELLQINPLLARSPQIQAGTPVNAYQSNTGGTGS